MFLQQINDCEPNSGFNNLGKNKSIYRGMNVMKMC